jgi:hypothetical protein
LHGKIAANRTGSGSPIKGAMQYPTAKSQSASCSIVNKLCAEGVSSEAEIPQRSI